MGELNLHTCQQFLAILKNNLLLLVMPYFLKSSLPFGYNSNFHVIKNISFSKTILQHTL